MSTYESPNHFDHWGDMLADLDRVERQLKIDVSPNSAAIWRVQCVVNELRHVARYAQDAESGNAALRARVEQLEAALPDPDLLRETAATLDLFDVILTKLRLNNQPIEQLVPQFMGNEQQAYLTGVADKLDALAEGENPT